MHSTIQVYHDRLFSKMYMKNFVHFMIEILLARYASNQNKKLRDGF